MTLPLLAQYGRGSPFLGIIRLGVLLRSRLYEAKLGNDTRMIAQNGVYDWVWGAGCTVDVAMHGPPRQSGVNGGG